MSRPTRSTSLYTQCVGRGLRPHTGKDNCMVIDFTDTFHRLDQPSDLIQITDVLPKDVVTQSGVVHTSLRPAADVPA
eukprot:353182-Chlamydomonas_euryale.AAC.13